MCVQFLTQPEATSCCAARFLLRDTSLAELGRELIEVTLRLLLALEECLKEVLLRGRQRVLSHCHRFDVLLKRYGFLERTLKGIVVDGLGFRVASSCQSRAWVAASMAA